MSFGPSRLVSNSLLVSVCGFCEIVLVEVSVAEIVVRLCIAGFQANRLVVSFDGFLELAVVKKIVTLIVEVLGGWLALRWLGLRSCFLASASAARRSAGRIRGRRSPP